MRLGNVVWPRFLMGGAMATTDLKSWQHKTSMAFWPIGSAGLAAVARIGIPHVVEVILEPGT